MTASSASAASSTSPASPTWRGRGRTRALLSLGLLVGPGAFGTAAFFTDRATVAGTSITADAMNLDLPGSARVRSEDYVWQALDLTSLRPGNQRAADLVVTNNSARAAFTFTVAGPASSSSALLKALTVTVHRDATASAGACTGGTAVTAVRTAFVGATSSAVGPVAAGDTARVCVEVALPSTASIPVNTSASAVFAFTATQVRP